MARLGRVHLFIEKESDFSGVDATTYPVEKGVPYTDHVNEKPDEFSLSGYIIGDNYQADKDYLKAEMKKGTVFTYVGRNIAKNVIILSIDGDVDASIANGSTISIKLLTIRIASTPWDSVPVVQKAQQKPVTNAGKKQVVEKKTTTAAYHTVVKGDTYWALAKKYKTTVEALRKLNNWPDRQIPIGVKLRYK